MTSYFARQALKIGLNLLLKIKILELTVDLRVPEVLRARRESLKNRDEQLRKDFGYRKIIRPKQSMIRWKLNPS